MDSEEKIKRGDIVDIATRGFIIRGTVLSATKHDGHCHLEVQTKRFGYVYWKQEIDGGSVELIASANNITV